MPLSGNTYVAPNWVDRGPPALDAEELNAISQTLVALQSGEISLQDAINALTTTVSGKAQIATGSYVGTGTYGASSTNVVTLPFQPRLFIVVINGTDLPPENIVLIYTGNSGPSPSDNAGAPRITVSGTTISWYSTYAANYQANTSGRTYYYFSIG